MVLALQICSRWNKRQHETVGGINMRMFELYTPGSDLQIHILEVIRLHGGQREV